MACARALYHKVDRILVWILLAMITPVLFHRGLRDCLINVFVGHLLHKHID